MEIGAQFYTLREQCRTLEDFAESLKKVADIGYRTVQISGVCPYEPRWLRDRLAETGLRCVITHTNPDRIADETLQVIADHDVFGCRFIGVGMMPGGLRNRDDYDSFVRRFVPAGREIAKAGKLLMYHNHNFEFMKAPDGKLYLEKLAEDFTAEELGFTLDTYWVQHGGGDPSAWLDRLAGRVPCVHLKDMACVDFAQRMAPVGEGNLNWDRILSHAESAGARYLLVEQDDCGGEDPFDCLRRSYEFLTARGLS